VEAMMKCLTFYCPILLKPGTVKPINGRAKYLAQGCFKNSIIGSVLFFCKVPSISLCSFDNNLLGVYKKISLTTMQIPIIKTNRQTLF